MTIKLVFADVDLTLMGRDHVLTERNIDTIRKVRELGIPFYIQTGRLPCAVAEVLDPLGMNHRDDEYMICGNGAIVSDTDLRFYTDHYMDEETVDQLTDYFHTVEGCVFAVVSAQVYYTSGTLISLNRNSSKIVEVIGYDEMKKMIKTTRIYKFLVQHSDHDTLVKAGEDASVISGGKAVAVFSAWDNLEIIPSGVSKAEGMKEFCEIMKISPTDILAIGDNYNDESMIDLAGYKACPANAVDVLKKKCDYVSPYDCTESAVADILEKMILNKQIGESR